VRLGTKTTILLAAIVSPVIITAGLLLLYFQEVSLEKTIFEGLDGQAKMAASGKEKGSSEVHTAPRERVYRYSLLHLRFSIQVGSLSQYWPVRSISCLRRPLAAIGSKNSVSRVTFSFSTIPAS
jgi:hypothetical protein